MMHSTLILVKKLYSFLFGTTNDCWI